MVIAFYPCSARKASTSARDGMEACAPCRVTEMAAAAEAKRAAAQGFLPSSSATANAPLKQSPAPTESMAWTGKDFTGVALDGNVGAFRAALEDYTLEALVQKALRGVFGRRFFAEIESGFGFVGSEPGDLVKDGVGQRGGGSGVENDGDAGLGAEDQGVSDGFNGQFQLAENHAGGTDQCSLEVDGG